jgi:peptide/nickel transport system substrate-binding protein
MKAISGEYDIVGYLMSLQKYPVFKEGEEKGNYHISLWTVRRDELAFAFNYTHKDPVLRAIFNDVRFRQAMSLAIDREEINDIVYFGKGVPRQQSAMPDVSFFEDWMDDYYAEYDPEKANKLLDEMGLKWNSAKEWRLRPDGKILTIIIDDHHQSGTPRSKICELTKDYWGDVGVKVELRAMANNLYSTKGSANERDTGSWCTPPETEFGLNLYSQGLRPPWQFGNGVAIEWWNWHNTGGAKGEEPPAEIKRLYAAIEEWKTTAPGSDDYMRLGKEILEINVKNLYQIGTAGICPWPVLVKNDLKNTPEVSMWAGEYQNWRTDQPDQWYFDR